MKSKEDFFTALSEVEEDIDRIVGDEESGRTAFRSRHGGARGPFIQPHDVERGLVVIPPSVLEALVKAIPLQPDP